MPDREKVINSIKACAHHPDHDCQSCDYCDNLFCFNDKLIEDFETLLKEQEPVKVQYTAMGGLRYGACPKCDARIDNLVNPKACGFCGQGVKWE